MYMTRKYYLLGLLGIIAGILIDQGTKMLAVAHLKGKEAILIIPNVFQLQYLENHGAAFGILQNKRGFLLVITICILAAIIFFYRKIPAQKRFLPLHIAMILVAAGALGNMIDRMVHGYVVDFLYFSCIRFPIFNIADCYVVIAAVIAVILIGFYYKEEDFEQLSLFSSSKKEETK